MSDLIGKKVKHKNENSPIMTVLEVEKQYATCQYEEKDWIYINEKNIVKKAFCLIENLVEVK